MRHNPHHASDDPDVVRALVREHPWTTIVSNGPDGLVASHYPVLLEDTEELVALTHVGRPDEEVHGFGRPHRPGGGAGGRGRHPGHESPPPARPPDPRTDQAPGGGAGPWAAGGREVLLVFQGRHGYVSPSWYAPGSSRAPTWNFTAVHAHGVPEILDEEENLAVLTRLVAHFEQHVDRPMYLDSEWGARAARGTVGLRIPISRFTTKVKMSQDKDEQSVQNVISELRADGPYSHPGLADDMERARGGDDDDVVLRRRADGATELRVGGVFVMDDVGTSSEQILAERAVELGARDVLVGGLGLGYTTRALLAFSQVQRVVVGELHPAVIEAVAAGHGAGPLEDPRLEIIAGDVRDVVASRGSTSLDAVLLDVDNGPDALVHESNAGVYGIDALVDVVRVLRPGGMLAIWSMADSPTLREIMEGVLDDVTAEPIPVRLQRRDEAYWILSGSRPR